MVADPWRRFFQAARWNGYAAHRTTGEAMVSMSHCQLVNCSVLIIEISRTGMPRTAATMSRLRRAVSSGSGSFPSSPSWRRFRADRRRGPSTV